MYLHGWKGVLMPKWRSKLFLGNGDVTSIAFHPRALYAGSTFAYLNDEPTENPFEDTNKVNHIGGRLNTIVNDQLVVVGHVPESEAVMPANAAIEIQFNRILDAQQLQASKDDLFTVTLDGAKLAGTISSQVNNSGTKLIYVPAQNFVDGRRYRVTGPARYAIYTENLWVLITVSAFCRKRQSAQNCAYTA